MRILFLLLILSAGCGPKNKSVTDQPAVNSVDSLSGYINHEFTKHGFSMAYPEDWEARFGDNPLLIAAYTNDSSEKFKATLVVLVSSRSETPNDSDTWNVMMEILNQKFDVFRIVDSKEGFKGSSPIRIVDYKGMIDSIHLGGTLAIIERKDEYILISGMADNDPAGRYIFYRPAFINCIKSVTLLE